MKLWLKTTAQACAAIAVIVAAAYPFLRSDPLADAQERSKETVSPPDISAAYARFKSSTGFCRY
jgi:hypothetical protein